MKKLKKILLINWLYFSKQIIDVEDINFLTGKNGAGKSTVIDALQIVLLGELNARNFNQAANEKSQRTLDGYLRADMDGNHPGSRRGKDFCSYIACEFLDETEGTRFVTGIVFDCRSDGSRQERFFIYDGAIPQNCFIEHGEAIDISALRSYLKQNYGLRATVYDTQGKYRADMLAKWNVHSEQVTRMLKKAVSFRPIVDIQKFITENICDIPDKPDIEAMQQNIRDYKHHEELARRQEEKLEALQEIGKRFRNMQQAIDRWQQQSFLVQWAQKETLQGKIHMHMLEKGDCEQRVQALRDQFDAISGEIEETDQRRQELIAICAQSDVSREVERLRTTKENLISEQKKLSLQLASEALNIKREALRLRTFLAEIEAWTPDDALAAVVSKAEAVEKAYAVFNDCDYQVFSKSAAVFEAAQQAMADFSAIVRDTAHAVKQLTDRLQAERDRKEAALDKLKRNIKDYPRALVRLKERLSEELSSAAGGPVQIDILADVLEIRENEEHWRQAVEGYLNTQKFYLLVEPRYYQAAVTLYDRIKRDDPGYTFGLVDIGKLREKETQAPWLDSLAGKVETENPLARSYIDYLLGRVVCCTHVSQLRKHRTAITADGMLYQGYVVRPIRRELMEDAFIGRRAIALRISRLEAELTEDQGSLAQWLPICQRLQKEQNAEPLFTMHFVQSTVVQRQADYLRGLEITTQLRETEEQLSGLDLFWLDEQRKKIRDLAAVLTERNKQRDQCMTQRALLEEQIKRLDYETLPELERQLAVQEERLSQEFTPEFQSRVGLPRYEQELARLKKAETVYANFSSRLSQTIVERDTAQRKLFEARRNYVEAFKPCAFPIEAMDNAAYDAEQQLLAESELPKYREKIKAAKESAMEQFQNDFLAKLKSSIDQVQNQVKSLNRALKQAQFGTDRYQFRADRNPDFAEYYDMIMDPDLMEGDAGLFAMPFQQKYGQLIEELFSRIAVSDDTQLNARKQSELLQNIERFTDFRTYLKFDLETTDQNGSRQLLSQTLNTKSGGETQTPFYIAVLASFAQLYQVNNLSGLNNTVRLVVFDEAFNKMDSDRIVESVRLLRKMGLQAIICTPPDKIPDIAPLANKTHLVIKDRYKMRVLDWSKEIRQI